MSSSEREFSTKMANNATILSNDPNRFDSDPDADELGMGAKAITSSSSSSSSSDSVESTPCKKTR